MSLDISTRRVIACGIGDNRLPTRKSAVTVAVRARVLGELARHLASEALDEDAVIDLVVQRTAVSGGQLCVLSLVDQVHSQLRIAGAAHPDREVADFFRHLDEGAPTPLGGGLAGRVAATRRTLLMTDLRGRELLRYLIPEQRARFEYPPEALRTFARDLAQVLIVPIRQPDLTLGTLGLWRWGKAAPFTPTDADWLAAVADLVALALANVRLHRETCGRQLALDAARRVDLALAASVDVRLALDVIMDQLVAHLGNDAVSLLAPCGQGGGLEVVAAAGLAGPARREGLVLGARHYAQAWLTGEAQVVPAGQLELWLAQVGLPGRTFGSVEIVPLLARGEPVGLLELFRHQPEERPAEALPVIESLALRAGIALDAYREHRAARDRLRLGGDLSSIEELSRAQLAVLRLLSEGTSNRQIAARLHISENTVKSHLREVFRKLGARTRLQAAMKGAAWLRADDAANYA